jgi:hypothetical protein
VRIRLALVLALAGTAVLPGAALAADGQESIIQDDFLLLQQGAEVRNRTLDDIVALGADTVRAVVYWRGIAPSATRTKRPKGVDFTNPAAYPAENWDNLDDLLRGAQARGLGVLLSPSSPIPNWGSGCSGSSAKRRTCKPNATLFGQFVQALGARYSGSYADENQGGSALPRVVEWSIWNEPNQPGWLYPQYTLGPKRVRIPTAAHMYRKLADAAVRGLAAAGHPAAEVLLGESAPLGRSTGSLARRPIPPVEFVREVFCLDKRGAKLRGSAAKIRGCTRPRRLDVGGFAHHPYTRGGAASPRTKGTANEITIASVSRLKTLLSRGAKAGRIPADLPIHYTEYGFQTNPPDRLFGVPPGQQAEWINESDWMAYQDERVVAVAQYKLIDEPNVANFQTGLRYLGGSAKPAYEAYRLPIWVVDKGAEVSVYGQIRPASGTASEVVLLQRSGSPDGPWDTVSRVDVSSPRGHLLTTAPAADGYWRLRWLPLRGAAVSSRAMKAAKR